MKVTVIEIKHYQLETLLTMLNAINKKYFQYDVTVALNNGETKKDLRRITRIKIFIYKYNWEGINYSSEKDDWKNLRKII